MSILCRPPARLRSVVCGSTRVTGRRSPMSSASRSLAWKMRRSFWLTLLERKEADMLELVIEGRRRDLGGGLEVGRVLPFARRRMVGPFIFLDHMGPADFRSGEGIDVRPHPHIGLATVTYLFDGEIHHRDSLGVSRKIRPGEVNWMTAGAGIVHSERTDPAWRSNGGLMHGMQAWVALPREDEETAPAFAHHDAEELPEMSDRGVWARLIAGAAYGLRNDVKTFSPLFYLHTEL